jgi:hypothetical protein
MEKNIVGLRQYYSDYELNKEIMNQEMDKNKMLDTIYFDEDYEISRKYQA